MYYTIGGLMMKKAMFILNPSAGKERASEYRGQVEETLASMGYEVDTRETQKAKDATHFAAEACEKKYDFVVAMGGDGTINEAVSGIAEQPHEPLFSLIPLGTVNDFARALGISLDPQEAIEASVSSTCPRYSEARSFPEDGFNINIAFFIIRPPMV